MAFSDYVENAVLGHVFGSTTFAKPAGRFLALFTTSPGDANAGTEVSTTSTGYARQSVAWTVSGTSPTSATNTAAIEFASATASWGTITHVGVYDTVTGGNLLAWAQLTTSKTVSAADIFRVPASNIIITLD